MVDVRERVEDEVVVWAEPPIRPQPVEQPPRACLMDWLVTLAIGLQVTGAAVCFIVALAYGALEWWCFRTATGAPLMLLGGALVARSLKRQERRP